jgi:hypothetical protein
MQLRWNGIEGEYIDAEENIIACDPSAIEPGPRVLLVNRQRWDRFLQEQGYLSVWIWRGRKIVVGGSHWNDWIGQLEIFRAYWRENDVWHDLDRTQYISRSDRKV